MPQLLTGTVTFLFTDVERSTEVLRRGPDTYAQALDDYRRLVREAAGGTGGAEVDCRGEEFFFAFPRASDAVAAAATAQSALAAHDWPPEGRLSVRMGIHTGEPMIHDQGYLGLDVHRAARICSLAHGGQVLVSRTTRDLLAGRGPPHITLHELGSHRLKGFSEPEEVFQLAVVGLPSDFPPLRTSEAGAAEPGLSGRERELAAAVVKKLAPRRPLGQLAGRLVARRAVSRGLADLGWEARARLPRCPGPLRGELAELGGELFAGSRSLVAVDRYLAGIDRKRLARRLAEHSELGVLSKRAAAEAEATARRIALVDDLKAQRGRADERIERIGAEVGRFCSHLDSGSEADDGALLAAMRRDVRGLTSDLDRALEAASGAVKAAGKLRRTRRRGIYRMGDRYVVPYFDEVGIEHESEFETIAAARAFRDARKVDEKGRIDFAPSDHVPRDSFPDGTGGW
jgi:class 3 adenylate cyclase